MKKLWAVGALLVLLGGAAFASDPIPNAAYELEGNAVVNSAPSDDWNNTVPPPPSGSSEALASVFVADGSGNATIFTGGGSKDPIDLNQWRWKNNLGGLPDKDNITNAYAAAYVNGANELTFYFGSDRFANSGDAQMGFWFFKNQVSLGGPSGGANIFVDGAGNPAAHAVGDLLVLIHMSNGGSVATAEAFRWVGGSNPLLQVSAAGNAKCGVNDDPDLCVISNAGNESAPWAYTPKAGVSGTFPTFSFIEGGINISVLGAGTGGCFSSFLAETRSSTSLTATLKDFALGEFNTCSIDISKTCPSVSYDAAANLLTYTSEITVSNNGFGSLFDLVVHDTPSDLSTTDFNLATLAAGDSHVFSHQFSYTPGPSTPNPPSNSASVEAASSVGGTKNVSGGPATAECPHVDFDSSLSISKAASCGLEVVGGKIVVRVDVSGEVCNNAPAAPAIPEAINDVSVTDTPSIDGQPIDLGDLASGQCKPYSSFYYPDALTGGSSDAGDQTFEDTALASGTGAVTASSKVNTATAHCDLCPHL